MDIKWSELNNIQLGRYAEYYAKMAFTAHGFYVFSAEVDDHGVDFVVRPSAGNRYYEVQVKSVRNFTYAYITKNKMSLDDKNDPLPENRLVCYLRFVDGCEPEIYLIPAAAWKQPNEIFKDRRYDGLKSKPEWGISISKKHLPKLEEYRFDKAAAELK